jgi:hypothetical protein
MKIAPNNRCFAEMIRIEAQLRQSESGGDIGGAIGRKAPMLFGAAVYNNPIIALSAGLVTAIVTSPWWLTVFAKEKFTEARLRRNYIETYADDPEKTGKATELLLWVTPENIDRLPVNVLGGLRHLLEEIYSPFVVDRTSKLQSAMQLNPGDAEVAGRLALYERAGREMQDLKTRLDKAFNAKNAVRMVEQENFDKKKQADIASLESEIAKIKQDADHIQRQIDGVKAKQAAGLASRQDGKHLDNLDAQKETRKKEIKRLRNTIAEIERMEYAPWPSLDEEWRKIADEFSVKKPASLQQQSELSRNKAWVVGFAVVCVVLYIGMHW